MGRRIAALLVLLAAASLDVAAQPPRSATGNRRNEPGAVTSPDGHLVRFAPRTDVLIHEVIDPITAGARRPGRGMRDKQARLVVAHHTTAEEAGIVFSRVPRNSVGR